MSVAKPNIQVGHSGYAHYSPISTLERQSVGAGRRCLLFVHANGACCPAGGVEAILKQTTTSSKTNGGGGMPHVPSETELSESSDPFSFLGQEEEEQQQQQQQVDEGTTTPAAAKKGPNIGRFLKKVAKTTTQQIERGVTSLAIRADQGRNKDLLVVGLYKNDQLLHMTESVPLPDEPGTGVSFGIPLVLPAPSEHDSQQQQLVQIKLWVRSGAALLSQTKAAKNYLVGSASLLYSQVRSLAASGEPSSILHVPLQSALVVKGLLTLFITSDLKFPPLCGRGSSLTDPDVQSYWKPGSLFRLPLDQSYGYALPDSNETCLVATERTTESVVVLPIAAAVAKLTSQAANVSLQRAQTMAAQVLQNRHDSAVDVYYDVQIGVGNLKTDPANLGDAAPLVSAVFQRPDSIFEVELLHPSRIAVQQAQGFAASTSFRFFPKPCLDGILPSVVAAIGGQVPLTGLLGNVRLEIVIPRPKQMINGSNITAENPFGPVKSTNDVVADTEERWDCVVNLESLLLQNSPPVMEFPVTKDGKPMGTLVLSVTLQRHQGPVTPTTLPPAQQGLVSVMGLPQLVPDGVRPQIDLEQAPLGVSDPQHERRRQQLATMGMFVSHAYLEQHLTQRAIDVQELQEKATQYRAALDGSGSSEIVPPHQDRSPKPFRPSSSRSTALLAGIGFNVHYASLSLQTLGATAEAGALFNNITCGAPADHARGFGDVFAKKSNEGDVGLNSPIGPVSGGLRRLEARRQELAQVVTDLEAELTAQVGKFFLEARQGGHRVVNHVPGRHAELQSLRWRLFEATQSLHHLTWICSVRRANVFSQALGIAVSSYLAALSDEFKLRSKWPDLWARHGYLVSVEGLLSAAGKELGMIEDAHVAIAMLNRVRVILVPDDGVSTETRVPVVSSPYLKWVDLGVSLAPPETLYTLQIGVVPSYFEQRIPGSLRNGTPVRFYSLLFEVGVDIRQWASNKSQIASNNPYDPKSPMKEAKGGLIDDEDDDVGIADEDVLVQLNFEAFHKLNAYAYAVVPAASQQSQSAQKTHPLLETLYQHIASSGGKINHDILDEAAGLAQQLGGGAAVFCKSGKDRTAMHVTFKQAQFANRYRQQHVVDGMPAQDTTLSDATLMRIYGTRLPICEKNVGQALYAFNSLQVKFMPDALKPPPSTLAGFLKGGEIFKGGGIES